MKISSEVKIGLLTIVTLAVSLWGFKFIQGKNMLRASNVYYVEYPSIDLLKKATDVTINGFPVGVVSDMYLKPNDPEKRIVVVLDLKRDIQIPKDARAVIVSTGFMGDKSVMIKYDRACTGPDCAQSGDYLKGELQGFMSYMLGGDGTMDAYMASIKSGFADLIDTLNQQLLSPESQTPIAESVADLRKSLANLESATAQLDQLMRRSGGKIDGTLGNLQSITGNFDSKEKEINTLIDNFSAVSTQMKEADLKKTLEEVKASVSNLKTTLATTEQTLGSVNTMMGKINAGEGSLGKLLKDDALFNDLSGLSTKADSLMTDIQTRPYRYMPLKSRARVKKFDRLDAKETGTKQ
ncbi:MAG: MCE family protein [Saprospiraceae bacterium]|nr:MCE family protein [Saprospiraceae bacterium]HRD82530.1 MlaD family protein [Saprospiraceae bacterium]HRJ14777.1 MlaD family protein [Saprospiraceae bacterium]HRK83131.1 MlaD family protein [Saprospiraceae bacterium]